MARATITMVLVLISVGAISHSVRARANDSEADGWPQPPPRQNTKQTGLPQERADELDDLRKAVREAERRLRDLESGNYGASAPEGDRDIAIDEARDELEMAKEALREAKKSAPPPPLDLPDARAELGHNECFETLAGKFNDYLRSRVGPQTGPKLVFSDQMRGSSSCGLQVQLNFKKNYELSDGLPVLEVTQFQLIGGGGSSGASSRGAGVGAGVGAAQTRSISLIDIMKHLKGQQPFPILIIHGGNRLDTRDLSKKPAPGAGAAPSTAPAVRPRRSGGSGSR